MGITRKFFTLMGISLEDIIIESQDEKKAIYLIQIKTPDSKILIGIHGQTLEIINHLLTRILENTLAIPLLIHLEINDYLQAKDRKFFQYLESRIAYVIRSGQEISLPNLSSYDRKKAHGYISDKKIEGFRTFSVGESKNRELHLSYIGQKNNTISSVYPYEAISTTIKAIHHLDDNGIGI